jgi:hypothetical protein
MAESRFLILSCLRDWIWYLYSVSVCCLGHLRLVSRGRGWDRFHLSINVNDTLSWNCSQ